MAAALLAIDDDDFLGAVLVLAHLAPRARVDTRHEVGSSVYAAHASPFRRSTRNEQQPKVPPPKTSGVFSCFFSLFLLVVRVMTPASTARSNPL